MLQTVNLRCSRSRCTWTAWTSRTQFLERLFLILNIVFSNVYIIFQIFISSKNTDYWLGSNKLPLLRGKLAVQKVEVWLLLSPTSDRQPINQVFKIITIIYYYIIVSAGKFLNSSVNLTEFSETAWQWTCTSLPRQARFLLFIDFLFCLTVASGLW